MATPTAAASAATEATASTTKRIVIIYYLDRSNNNYPRWLDDGSERILMVAGLVIGDQLLVMGMSMNNGGAERRCIMVAGHMMHS